jgi:anti-sigma28 factor (negative regulator of flagellin synthesis)
MTTHHLPNILCSGWIQPARSPLPAGVNETRVRAMQLEIAAGRYAPDSGEVADGVLSAIAPARRH